MVKFFKFLAELNAPPPVEQSDTPCNHRVRRRVCRQNLHRSASLQWRAMNYGQYSNLLHLARINLVISATPVFSERSCPKTVLIISECRTVLTARHVEQVAFCRSTDVNSLKSFLHISCFACYDVQSLVVYTGLAIPRFP